MKEAFAEMFGPEIADGVVEVKVCDNYTSWSLDSVNTGYHAIREHIHDRASRFSGGFGWTEISRPFHRMV